LDATRASKERQGATQSETTKSGEFAGVNARHGDVRHSAADTIFSASPETSSNSLDDFRNWLQLGREAREKA
jgi:hypothetical protein